MNDRLKYRIYDTVEGEYIEVDAVRLTPNGIVVWTEKTEPELNPKRYIIEFCTGLKDRHGKLIYEGDIVTCGDDREWVVIWDDTFWQVKEIRQDGCININVLTWCTYDEIEIIGNIHQDKNTLDFS